MAFGHRSPSTDLVIQKMHQIHRHEDAFKYLDESS